MLGSGPVAIIFASMGMFDLYEPYPVIGCPYCGTQLAEWQGKDGPCALFFWRQGMVAPLRHQVDEECRLPTSKMEQFRLPMKFRFYSRDIKCRFCPVYAVGQTKDQMWVSTTFFLLSDAPYHEMVDLNEDRSLSPHLWRRQ